MYFGRSWSSWIDEYQKSHTNRWNQLFHLFGIPTVVLSIVLLLLSIFIKPLFLWGLALFGIGWVAQFVGHWFEGKPPEFVKDWRFLFVGVRWWLKKLTKS